MTLLAYEEALDIQHRLIKEYRKAAFQVRLHDEWRRAKGILSAQRQALRDVCWDAQRPILEWYGFEESYDGVTALQNNLDSVPATEEMDEARSAVAWLLSPDHQEDWPEFVPDVDVPGRGHENLRAGDLTAKGSRWLVVGGQQGRGLLVRKGEDLESPAFPFRLHRGAQLRAVEEVVGNRLHYRRLSGDGPDFGWVSIEVNGNELVKPDLDGTSTDKRYGTAAHLCNVGKQGFRKDSRAMPSWAFSMRGQLAYDDKGLGI